MDAASRLAALPLAEAADAGEAAVGGKAMGLARLVAMGLPVPDAVVLPVGWAGGGEDVLAAAAGLPPPYAVRSSAVGEDSSGHSAAGQYVTVTGVREPAALVAAVARCLESAGSDRVSAYLGGERAPMAVVIQHQVGAGRSGVAFSVDPVSGARGAVLVEAVFGYGEGIVGGLVSPDRYRVFADGRVQARRSLKPLAVDGAGRQRRLPQERQGARTLRDDEALAVAGLVRRAEAGFGAPVDIEFCFAGPRLWLLQCRPITGLEGR